MNRNEERLTSVDLTSILDGWVIGFKIPINVVANSYTTPPECTVTAMLSVDKNSDS
jgi:hypothetical protein